MFKNIAFVATCVSLGTSLYAAEGPIMTAAEGEVVAENIHEIGVNCARIAENSARLGASLLVGTTSGLARFTGFLAEHPVIAVVGGIALCYGYSKWRQARRDGRLTLKNVWQTFTRQEHYQATS